MFLFDLCHHSLEKTKNVRVDIDSYKFLFLLNRFINIILLHSWKLEIHVKSFSSEQNILFYKYDIYIVLFRNSVR